MRELLIEIIEIIGIGFLRLEKNRWVTARLRECKNRLQSGRKLIKKEIVLISFLKQFLGMPRIFFF